MHRRHAVLLPRLVGLCLRFGHASHFRHKRARTHTHTHTHTHCWQVIAVPPYGGPNIALRTYVYHQLLIGYLQFVKMLGYEQMYIWACPPMQVCDCVCARACAGLGGLGTP